MGTYFHCAPIPLGIGSIIEPGNWGRIVKLYVASPNNVPINGLNEMNLEHARLAYCPDKVSRLECIFVLEDQNEAIAYRARHASINLIYEVEPLVTNSGQFPSRHIGNYELAIQQHSGLYVQNGLISARDYWTAEHSQNREVLLPTPVRVLSRIG